MRGSKGSDRGVRGASLRQPLPWVFSQTQGPCFPCSPLTPLTPSCSLLPPEPPYAFLGHWDFPGASGSLGSLHKPSAAFGSLGSSVILRGSAFLAPTHPLTFSHSFLPPLAPEHPWVSLGPWDLPGASGSLGRLCKPLAALGL